MGAKPPCCPQGLGWYRARSQPSYIHKCVYVIFTTLSCPKAHHKNINVLGWDLAIARYQPRPCGQQGGLPPPFFRNIFGKSSLFKNNFGINIFFRNILDKNIFSEIFFCENIFSRIIFSENMFLRNIFGKNIFSEKNIFNLLVHSSLPLHTIPILS